MACADGLDAIIDFRDICVIGNKDNSNNSRLEQHR